MIQIAALRSCLEKQPTGLRRNPRDLGDGAPKVRQQFYLFLAQQAHLARTKSPVSKRSYSNSLQASDFVVKGCKDTPNLTLESLGENDAYLLAIDLEYRLKTSSAFGQIHTLFLSSPRLLSGTPDQA